MSKDESRPTSDIARAVGPACQKGQMIEAAAAHYYLNNVIAKQLLGAVCGLW